MNKQNPESDYRFETFTGRGKSHKKKISIRKSGQIGISVGTVRAYNLEEYKGFVLHYDRENKVIGIEPTNNAQKTGFISGRLHNGEIQIGAASFFDYYDIPYNKTKRAPVVGYDEDANLIIADIKGIVNSTGSE